MFPTQRPARQAIATPSPVATSGLVVEIDLAGAAGGEHGVARGEGQHALALDVEHVGARAACAGLPQLVRGDEIDRDVVLVDVDVPGVGASVAERRLHRRAGGVRGVDDAPVEWPPSRVRW